MSKFSMTRRSVLGAFGASASLAVLARPAWAAEPLRVGALNPVTGAASAFGSGMQKTILECAKRINAAGGVAGRQVEVFAEDSQTSPEPALLAARKLIEVNRVAALLGVYSSPEALALIPVTNGADVILMHNGAAPKLAADNVKKLAFQFYPDSVAVGKVMFEIVKREGFRTPATLTLTNDASIANSNAFAAAWTAAKGAKPQNLQYQPGQPSYRAELQTLLAANPDVIVLNGYEPDATILIRQLYELGSSAQIIAPEFAVTPRLIAALGKDQVEGTLVYRFVPNRDSQAFRNFDEVYRAATGQPGTSNVFAAMAFDEINILCLAAEKAGADATPAKIAAALHDICGPEGQAVYSFEEGRAALKAGAARINYQGASGPVDFDERGLTLANFGVSVVNGGEYKPKFDVTFGK